MGAGSSRTARFNTHTKEHNMNTVSKGTRVRLEDGTEGVVIDSWGGRTMQHALVRRDGEDTTIEVHSNKLEILP